MKKQTLFNVAEYIRLSREDGDKAESDSIGNQRKLIADFLKGKDEFVVYDTYVDDGFTGLSFQRPSFMRMMDDIEDGNVNCVVVKDACVIIEPTRKSLYQMNISMNIERQSAVGTSVLADGLPLYFCFRQWKQKSKAYRK